MNTKAILVSLCASSLLACAHAAEAPKAANTSHFPCQGFTRQADGTWMAGPNTKPFDLGTNKGVQITNSGPIDKHFMKFADGSNLWEVLEMNCGPHAMTH
jgi:hypothetical protein